MLDGWDVSASCLDSSRQALKWHQIQSAEQAGQPAWSTYALHVTFLDPNVKRQTLVHWLRRWWWGRNPKAGHENSSILSNLTIDHFTPLNNPARDLFCFVAASHQVSSVGRFAFRIPCLMLGHHGSFGNGCQRYQVLRLAPISASASEGSPAIRIGQVTGQEIRSTWLPEVQRTSQNITEHQLTRVLDSKLYEKMFLWSLDVTLLIKLCHLKCTLAKSASFSIAPFPVPSSSVISSAMDQTEKHTWFTSHWYTATRDTNNK